ncbi:MAG: hypothetical protein OZSIB_1689 [Candidatus Ozemobacter sibiricus]|uniref:Tetratricopeptide repeat protein n=1 Tax=Candidatus Ozemobacter sibiricus TaxID=2268124 RepID=A0A367ZJ64_9BACT|nr:MAG: hypothetical protein OZSIB_1689 [Candidatus Ozemobacter sibiricus]
MSPMLRRWLLLASMAPFLLAMHWTVAAQGTKESSVEARLYQRATDLFRQGKLDEAMADLERVRKLRPDHPGAQFHQAEIWLKRGDLAKATALLKGLVGHAEFGSRARQRLADLEAARRARSIDQDVQAYLEGGAWKEALQAVRRGLERQPDKPELLWAGAFAAAMVNDQMLAEQFYERYAATRPPAEPRDDLRRLLHGWFARDHAPAEAIENLRGIADQRLRPPLVMKVLQELMLANKRHEEFEQLLLAEARRPGANVGAIERDLVRFYTETGQYEKGLRLLNRRPIESLEDNLSYIELLTLSAQEERAMTTARTLLGLYPDELRLHYAWLRAFHHLVGRTGKVPEGKDASGSPLRLVAVAEVNRILNSKTESGNPTAVLTALRTAIVLHDQATLNTAVQKMAQLPVEDRYLDELIEAAEDMTERHFRAQAIAFLEILLGQRPDEPRLQRVLAENYYLDNRTLEALELLRSAHAADPRSIRTLLLLVDAMTSAGQAEKALELVLERLKDPDLEEAPRRQLKAKANILGAEIDAGPAGVASPSEDDAGATAPATRPDEETPVAPDGTGASDTGGD